VPISTICFQGGYHELHNEPDGVKEKLAETIIAFVQKCCSNKNATVELAESSSGPASRTEGAAESDAAKAKM
jgi:acylglycerol lipase